MIPLGLTKLRNVSQPPSWLEQLEDVARFITASPRRPNLVIDMTPARRNSQKEASGTLRRFIRKIRPGSDNSTPVYQGRCVLLTGLPLELRMMIFEHVLGTLDTYQYEGDNLTIVEFCKTELFSEAEFTCFTGMKRRTPLAKWRWPLGENARYWHFTGRPTYHYRPKSPWPACNQPPGIMLTCKQAYLESLVQLYGKKTFRIFGRGFSTIHEYPQFVSRLNLFGDRNAWTYIRKLEVPLPLPYLLHTDRCSTCRELWEQAWNTLRAFELRSLTLDFVSRYEFIVGNVWSIPFLCPSTKEVSSLQSSRQRGSEWLELKLLALKRAEIIRLRVQFEARGLFDSLQLDPDRFIVETVEIS